MACIWNKLWHNFGILWIWTNANEFQTCKLSCYISESSVVDIYCTHRNLSTKTMFDFNRNYNIVVKSRHFCTPLRARVKLWSLLEKVAHSIAFLPVPAKIGRVIGENPVVWNSKERLHLAYQSLQYFTSFVFAFVIQAGFGDQTPNGEKLGSVSRTL